MIVAHESSRGPWRLEIEARIRFDAPVRVASGERLSLMTDLPLLQDDQRRAWIPGSSIRGVLRDWCEREALLVGVGNDVVDRLFGVTPEGGSKTASATSDRQGRLTVRDLELGQDATHVDFRDHVRINREWNSAAHGGKFDEQVSTVDGGTIRLVYHGDSDRDDELRLIGAALFALEQGQLALGGRGGSGFGWIQPDTRHGPWLKRLVDNRKQEPDLAAYVTRRLGFGAGVQATAPAENELWRHPPIWEVTDQGKPSRARPWNWLTFKLKLNFDGPMVIVGQNRRQEGWIRDTDDAFLTNVAGDAVLPGSSFRGVLKSNADRIVASGGEPDLKKVRDALFGTPKLRGLLHVGEARLPADQARPIQLDHVAIDRLTGFAATNKLFQVAALQSPSFIVNVRVRWHDDVIHQRAVALLFFLIRDISTGRGWVGSRTTRGYGHLKSVEVAGLSGSRVTVDTGIRGSFVGLDWSNANGDVRLSPCFSRWSELWEQAK